MPALSASLMAPSYHAPEIPASGKFSGVIFTSRHAVTGLCAATGGKLDDRRRIARLCRRPRHRRRAARKAGFRECHHRPWRRCRACAADHRSGPASGAYRSCGRRRCIADSTWWRRWTALPMSSPSPVYEMRETKTLPDDAVAAIAGGNVLGVILMSARSARLFRERLLALGQTGRLPPWR